MGKETVSGTTDKTSLSSKDADKKNPLPGNRSIEEMRAEELHGIANDFYTLIKSASRRWEMIIYPAILGLFIMSGVFFSVLFMIIMNIQDAVEEAQIGNQMNQVARNMAGLTDNIRIITVQMAKMQKSLVSMDSKMSDIKYMRVMSKEIAQMNNNMAYMNQNMGQMRADFSVLNRNVSKPMSMMNSFMPW